MICPFSLKRFLSFLSVCLSIYSRVSAPVKGVAPLELELQVVSNICAAERSTYNGFYAQLLFFLS